MLLSTGTLLVVAYLALSINVYLESQALGRFSIGYGLVGPTEARLALIGLNSALALGFQMRFEIFGDTLTALDGTCASSPPPNPLPSASDTARPPSSARRLPAREEHH